MRDLSMLSQLESLHRHADRRAMNSGTLYKIEQAELKRDELHAYMQEHGAMKIADIASGIGWTPQYIRDATKILLQERRVKVLSTFPREWEAV